MPNKAHAPYNFVPHPETRENVYVKQFTSRFNQFKGYSGFIELEINTLTPTLIGDIQEDGKVIQNFAVNNQPIIPGSSLRGMIRSLFEITTFSELSHIDKDRQLFFRSVADIKKVDFLAEQYKKDELANAKVGIIFEKDGEFYIRPTESIKGLEDLTDKLPKGITTDNDLKNNQMNYQIEHGQIVWYSGFIPKKRARYKLPIDTIPLNKDGDLKISSELIQSFKQDVEKFGGELRKKFKDRKSPAVDLLDPSYYLTIPLGQRNFNLKGLPVFYTTKEGQISHFGHTKYSRRAYQNSIGDIAERNVPEETPQKTTDLARRVFGDKENLASRVYFTDATLDSDHPNAVFEEKIRLKPLLSPKPTSFQLYLQQNKDKFANIAYDSTDAKLRGFKLFFHRPYINHDKGWEYIQSKDAKDSVSKTIRPIKKGVRFKSKIHYQNLTKLELGALLFTLKLPNDCAFKIGMGKPFGLGSIRIELKNNVKCASSKSVPARFKKFATKGRLYHKNMKLDSPIKTFKSKMSEFTKPFQWSNPSPFSWKDNDRLRILRHMLTYEERDSFDWFKITDYMGNSKDGKVAEGSMKPYRERWSLPNATDVIATKIQP